MFDKSDFDRFKETKATGLHPDIQNNLDKILRSYGSVWNDEEAGDPSVRDADGIREYLEQSRAKLKADGYREVAYRAVERLLPPSYRLLRPMLRSLTGQPDTIPNATDILVPLVPFRPDHFGLLAPVTERLARDGYDITLFVPWNSDEFDVEAFGDVSVLHHADFVTSKTVVDVKRSVDGISDDLDYLSGLAEISAGKRALERYYFKFYLQKHVFGDVLAATEPRLVFALHFMTKLGYLSAIEETSPGLPVVFIQHGAMAGTRAHTMHDFKGADTVLMWGVNGVAELDSRTIPERPAVEVVGNPKIEQIRDRLASDDRLEANTADALFVSSVGATSEHSGRALEQFSDAVDGTGLTVRYCPHPSEDMELYEKLIDDGRIDESEVVTDRSVYELLYQSKVVVGTQSTALLEAVVLDTPVIQSSPDLSTVEWADTGMLGAETEDRLREYIYRLLDSNTFREDVLENERRLAGRFFDNYDRESVAADAAQSLRSELR